MPPIRVLLADDHAMVRAGIRMLLEQLPDVRVVAEACDGRSAVEQTQRYHPDIVLMDITMPGLLGLDAARQIAARCPDVRVIMLSVHDNVEYVLEARGAGACGYLLKESGPDELHQALKAVMAGGEYLSQAVSRAKLDAYMRRLSGKVLSGRVLDAQLTQRQRQILKMIAEGATTLEIAQHLKISAKTVETHRSLMMKRLDIYDVPHLVRFAVRAGLVSP